MRMGCGQRVTSSAIGGDCAALVIRYEGGGTLHDLLHSKTSPCILSIAERIRILKEIAHGLQHLHNCDDGYIVHGDLKPQNILLNENREVRLIDFGLSKFKESIGSEVMYKSSRHVGGHVGTLAYEAPELEIHALENSRTSDMYSFGTICWEVLSGKQPWSQYPRKTMLKMNILEGGSLEFEALPPNTPDVVVQLIRRCLSFSKDEMKQQRHTALEAYDILSRAHDMLGGKRDIFLSYAWGKKVEQVITLQSPRKGSFFSSITSSPSPRTRKAMSSPRAVGSGEKIIKEYSRQPLSLQIYKELRRLQFTVWMDVFDMGNDLRESMRNGIRNSRSMVVLLSPEYLQSQSCRFELEEALKYAEEIKSQGGEYHIIACMVCRDTELQETKALYSEIETKLQLKVRRYCSMLKAADAEHLGLKFSWGDPNLSAEQRALLTHDPDGFMLLRDSLNRYGIQGTDGTSIGPESEHSLEPNLEKVEHVKNLIALEEEINARVGPKRTGNRPPRLVFPENDDDDDFREDFDDDESEDDEDEDEVEDEVVESDSRRSRRSRRNPV